MEHHWIETFSPSRREELYEFYKKEWWTEGRSFEDVVRVLEHSSLAIGCCTGDGKLIGFARVLTDYTFKAMIFDVIVDSSARGLGIGQAIVNRIIAHETLTRVQSFELYCPDRLVPFYSKLGFAESTSKLLRFRPQPKASG